MSFDDDAKNWDNETRIDRARIVAKEIENSICTSTNYSAMEFGCGTGLVSFNLYDKFKTITLIDSSKGMIDILNTKIEHYKVKNMTACYLDLSSGNIPDMNFDVIYNSMVLHHIHDTEDIINTFYKLLNDDGCLCIVDLDKEDGSFHKDYPDFDGHNGFDQKDLKDILIDAGFKNVESHSFYYNDKMIEGKKIPYSLFILTGRKL